MPYYPSLRDYKVKAERTRIIDNILRLKKSLNAQVPPKDLEGNLLVATWNIRELGKNNKAARLKEALYYMGEIITSFDLVAIQEVGEDLTELKTLVKMMDKEWDFIVTDVTEGASGNGERLGFVYDTRKVSFRNIAGEIVLPESKTPVKQIARTPFIVAFQSGWFRFYITTVHIYYGKVSQRSAEFKRRVKEIGDVASFLKKRLNKEIANHLLLGDFNITGTDKKDPTMSALRKGGFRIPKNMEAHTDRNSNTDRTMPYDQFAYIDQPGYMEFADGKKSVGVLDFYKDVFRDEDESFYKKEVAKTNLRSYKEWKTYQMSDHLPLWLEFKVDFSINYLNKLKSDEY